MMKALLTDTFGDTSVQELTSPSPKDDQILLRTLGCGICGTDILKIDHKMLKSSTVLGHEWVGEILEVGKKIPGLQIGDRIVAAHHYPCGNCHFCKHQQPSMCPDFKKTNFTPGGFAEKVVIDRGHLEQVSRCLPKEMTVEEALFTEPLACCLRNVERLPLLQGDSVAIVGLGSIGLMMSSLLAQKKCSLIGVDLDEKRCENSLKYGIEKAFTSTQGDFLDYIRFCTDSRGLDGVIFTAGPASLLNISLSWVRYSGFVNLFSHLSGEMAEIDTSLLYHNELQIITTYSSSPESFHRAFDCLKKDELQLRRMLSSPYSPENFSQAIHDIRSRKILKAWIKF